MNKNMSRSKPKVVVSKTQSLDNQIQNTSTSPNFLQTEAPPCRISTARPRVAASTLPIHSCTSGASTTQTIHDQSVEMSIWLWVKNTAYQKTSPLLKGKMSPKTIQNLRFSIGGGILFDPLRQCLLTLFVWGRRKAMKNHPKPAENPWRGG